MRLLSLTAFLTTALYSQTAPAPQKFMAQLHLRPLVPALTQPWTPVSNSMTRLTRTMLAPAARACAVPLLNVLPRDANPDPRMIIRPKAGSNMPQVAPPAPSCDDLRRP